MKDMSDVLRGNIDVLENNWTCIRKFRTLVFHNMGRLLSRRSYRCVNPPTFDILHLGLGYTGGHASKLGASHTRTSYNVSRMSSSEIGQQNANMQESTTPGDGGKIDPWVHCIQLKQTS